jgi:peptidoglycan/xylan/chitin deacetylase (PgdA/CDA1 family)
VGRGANGRRIALSAVKMLAAGYDRLHPHRRGIVVLGYHRTGRRTSVRVDLPEWLFEEQIARLAAGPGVIGIDGALAALSDPAPTEPDPVVVTFDDGTRDFTDVALPILVRHRVPATLYVATDFIETGRSFPNDGKPASWAALADALSTGLVTIGSHTHSHTLLDRITEGEVIEELDRSIGLIGDRLGVEALHFAYPKALGGSPHAEWQVRSRFKSAALAGTRPNPYERTDPHRLNRSPIQLEDGLDYFERKARGGMRLEDDLRRLASRRRFASAVT